ncbi:hypothetical protein FHT86_002153 [Rhizobium sp. BK313]|uniref:hypothetical protein n=1 Tax=Rhizobium sp. BK313 TaxID=2587081 RepID=UPI001608DAFB|nr:hypothetical protein [Rhizobium sp. BK313]MBB3453897.1 hypothetical protein [Rhizobium sp. BK313]
MATLYISEFPGLATIGTTIAAIPGEPSIADQAIAIGAGSVQSNAFSANTRLVLLSADVACSVLFAANPVAAVVNMRIPANFPMLFAVVPGQKVAVIANT